MSRNDVLGVGAATSILLFSGAWLTGYWDNRLFAWLAILIVVIGSSALAWYNKNKKATYQDIAKSAALFSVIIYLVGCLIGLVATRWAHGTWSPEIISSTDGILNKLFNRFPGDFMITVLHPNFSTMVFGSLIIAVWSALGSSFLPIKEQPKTNSKKTRK